MPDTKQPYQITLGQDVIKAIKINADVAEGVFKWQGIVKAMPRHCNQTSTKIDSFCEDNPKLALFAVFSQQNNFLQRDLTGHQTPQVSSK